MLNLTRTEVQTAAPIEATSFFEQSLRRDKKIKRRAGNAAKMKNMNSNKIIITAAIFGIIAIAFGAFGAHALKEKLDIAQLATFETGVRYQMYHALFLFFVASFTGISEKARASIYYCTLIGVILFSGSIYLLATQTLTGINFKPIGFVTPIGGLLLLISWFLLLVNLLRKKS